MKLTLKKQKGIDIWRVFEEQKDTSYTVRKDFFLTRPFYLLYKKNRLLGRFENMKDVYEMIAIKILDERADVLVGKK